MNQTRDKAKTILKDIKALTAELQKINSTNWQNPQNKADAVQVLKAKYKIGRRSSLDRYHNTLKADYKRLVKQLGSRYIRIGDGGEIVGSLKPKYSNKGGKGYRLNPNYDADYNPNTEERIFAEQGAREREEFEWGPDGQPLPEPKEKPGDLLKIDQAKINREALEPVWDSEQFKWVVPAQEKYNKGPNIAEINKYIDKPPVKTDYDGSKIEQDPYKVLQGLSISQGATTNTTNTGTGYTEADKRAWLDKTRNSPAALAGIPDNQRWELQVAHRKWVEDRQKGNKNRRSLMDILTNRRPGVVGKKTNPNNIIPTVQQVEDGY